MDNDLELYFGKVEDAISIMREVAARGRDQGYREYGLTMAYERRNLSHPMPNRRISALECLTEKLPVLSFSNGQILTIGPMHLSMKLPISTNSVCGANLPEWV